MSYYSNGSISIDVAYELPVYLRNFYYNLLVETNKKENSATADSSKSTTKKR